MRRNVGYLVSERKCKFVAHVQVRVPAVFINAVGVLHTAWVRQASEECIGRIVDGVGKGISRLKSQPATRTLCEVDRTRVVDAAAERRIRGDVRFESKRSGDVGLETPEGSIGRRAGGARCRNVRLLEESRQWSQTAVKRTEAVPGTPYRQ